MSHQRWDRNLAGEYAPEFVVSFHKRPQRLSYLREKWQALLEQAVP
jgi:hypothetical protein